MSDGMRRFVGFFAAFFTLAMAFAAASLAKEKGQATVAWICAVTALFLSAVAMACFWPASRPVTTRVVGAFICLACIAVIVNAFADPPDEKAPGRVKLLAMYGMVAVGGGVAAIWGGFPDWLGGSAAATPEPTRDKAGPPPRK